MTRQYPDVMNDLTDARLRFESGFVQYLAEFGPGPVPAGDVAQLVLTLQNTLDAPLRVRTHVSLPRPRGRLRRMTQAPFEIGETVVRLTLQDGEVGQLILRGPCRVRGQSRRHPCAPQLAQEPAQGAKNPLSTGSRHYPDRFLGL
jgi:hypothetical protein